MDFITPRSITSLEEEIEALEKGTSGEQPEEVIEEVVVEEGAEAPAVSKEEETWKKRHGDLRRQTQKKEQELKDALARVKALEEAKTTSDLPSVEEAETWAKENPKAAAIIRALANEQVSPSTSEMTAIRQELEMSKQKIRIEKVHPDFEDITGEDGFHTWAEEQTQSVQKLIYDGDADDVIWAVGLYKKEKITSQLHPNKEAAKSVANKASSAPTDTSGKKRFSESQVQKMSLAEYEANEDAISQSQRSGSFVYDLSGAAR